MIFRGSDANAEMRRMIDRINGDSDDDMVDCDSDSEGMEDDAEGHSDYTRLSSSIKDRPPWRVSHNKSKISTPCTDGEKKAEDAFTRGHHKMATSKVFRNNGRIGKAAKLEMKVRDISSLRQQTNNIVGRNAQLKDSLSDIRAQHVPPGSKTEETLRKFKSSSRSPSKQSKTEYLAIGGPAMALNETKAKTTKLSGISKPLKGPPKGITNPRARRYLGSAKAVQMVVSPVKTGSLKTKSEESSKSPKKSVQRRRQYNKDVDTNTSDESTFGDSETEKENDAVDEDIEESEEPAMLMTPTKSGAVGNLACSSRDPNIQAMLEHAVLQLGRYRMVSFPGDLDVPLRAYIIGKETKRGWGLLRAVASGVPLVSEDWLSKSISDGVWADMNEFRSDRFGQVSRNDSCVDATNSNSILDGMRVKVACRDDASKIRKLVTVCGGRVAETRVDVVIGDSVISDGITHVHKKWLADSIEAGSALDLEDYDISEFHVM